MKKTIFIIFIVHLNSHLVSQAQHFLGLGFGQTRGSPSHFDEIRAEVEINYSFSLNKFFIANAKITTLPLTKFGIENRFLLNFGFTTPQNKMISFQLLTGFGYLSSSSHKKYQGYAYRNIGSPCAMSSILFNPFKDKKLLFGIQVLVFREWMTYSRYDTKSVPVSYGLNLYYLLNAKKREGLKNESL